jgi:hypothetical protein
MSMNAVTASVVAPNDAPSPSKYEKEIKKAFLVLVMVMTPKY